MILSEKLKKDLTQGKLQKAVNQLLEISKKSRDNEFYHSIIMLSGNIKTIIRDKMEGEITDETERAYIAKAKKSALFYIDEYIDDIDASIANTIQYKERILFLGANPPKTKRPLSLTQEIARVQDELDRSILRDTISLNQFWDITPVDIARRLLEIKPTIFHFSGHGEPSEGRIVVHKDAENYSIIENEALANILNNTTSIQCIVLNCCYSEKLAKIILEKTAIKNIIGMSKAIPDKAAISFAKGFYMAIGAGEDYESAYEIGKSIVELEGVNGADIPVFKKLINE